MTGVLIYSCESTAPDYERRIKKIGMRAIKCSETYDSTLNYKDAIEGFGYGGGDLYYSLSVAKLTSKNARVEPGKGDLDGMYRGNKAGYYMKLIDGKKEVWVRLRYDKRDNKFHMVNFITMKK